MIRSLTVLLANTLLAGPVFGAQTPAADNPTEPRMVSVPYSPRDVIPIFVPANGRTSIVLSPAETSFFYAKSLPGWELQSAGNTLAISPSAGAITTVAHVISPMPDGSNRYYTFELNASAEGVKATPPMAVDAVLASTDPMSGVVARPPSPTPYLSVRLTYAADDARAKLIADAARRTAAQQQWRAQRAAVTETAADRAARAGLALESALAPRRCNFLWRGDAAILPLEACETGARTTFLWPGQMAVAAVFRIAADGTEQSVTQAPAPSKPGEIVMNETSRFWRIRRGALVADLYDASFTEIGQNTGTDTISPGVRTRLRGGPGATP